MNSLNPEPQQTQSLPATDGLAPPANSAPADPSHPLGQQPQETQPAPPPKSPELEDWKSALRNAVEHWLAAVQTLPPEAMTQTPSTDPPDLHSLFEQLTIVATESRRLNRRTIDALNQWTALMQGFDANLADVRSALLTREETSAMSREVALALLDLLDRLDRMHSAFARQPKPGWGWGWSAWRHAWSTQTDALDIVREHLLTLLSRTGIERVPALHAPFDPRTMTALSAEPDPSRAHHTVIEEISPGYRQGGEVLRTAQVKVSVNRSPTTV